MSRFKAISALKSQQSRASNRRVGARIKPHKVISICLSGIKTDLTKGLLGIIIGVIGILGVRHIISVNGFLVI
jgi:hypothetical protein